MKWLCRIRLHSWRHVLGDETQRKAYNVQSPDYRAGKIYALRRFDWAWLEQLVYDILIFMIVIGAFGYGVLRGCDAGCGYVRDHVEVHWK